MLREAGYAQRSPTPRNWCCSTRPTASNLLPAAPRHRGVRGRGHPRCRHHRPRHAARLRCPATEVIPLGFGRSRFRFAAPSSTETTVEGLDQKRLATSYPGLVGGYLADRGVVTRVDPLDGAVETAIRLGVADAIADVVETGTTLRQAGLELFGDPILQSEAILIRRSGADPSGSGGCPPGNGHSLRVWRKPAAATERRPGRAQRPVRWTTTSPTWWSTRRAPSPPGSNRRPWRRWPGRLVWPYGSWSRGPRRRRSWTTCGRSVPARSWSPTSRRAGLSASPRSAAPGPRRPGPHDRLRSSRLRHRRGRRGPRARRARFLGWVALPVEILRPVHPVAAITLTVILGAFVLALVIVAAAASTSSRCRRALRFRNGLSRHRYRVVAGAPGRPATAVTPGPRCC